MRNAAHTWLFLIFVFKVGDSELWLGKQEWCKNISAKMFFWLKNDFRFCFRKPTNKNKM